MADRANGMKFLVLGPLDVAGNGDSTLGGPKQRAVLGMLVSRVGQTVSNDSLADGIWGEDPPSEVSTSLRSYVSNLRAAIGADGKLVYTSTNVIDFQGIFDTETGELRGTALEWPMNGFEAAFTPDGRRLVLASWEGTVFVFDVAALLAGAPADEALVREIPAHDTSAMRVSVSPDGTKIASWGRTDPVKVWDLATGQLLGQFGDKIEAGFRQHQPGERPASVTLPSS